MVCYSPWSCKESDMTEQITCHFTSCLQHHYWFCVFVLLINLWSGISVSLKLWLSLFFQLFHFSIYWKPYYKVKVKVIQSCPTLCDPMDCIVHGILQARILQWVAFPFSRGIFPTQGSNPGLPHCRWILYQLSHKVHTNTKILCLL